MNKEKKKYVISFYNYKDHFNHMEEFEYRSDREMLINMLGYVSRCKKSIKELKEDFINQNKKGWGMNEYMMIWDCKKGVRIIETEQGPVN